MDRLARQKKVDDEKFVLEYKDEDDDNNNDFDDIG